MKILIFGFLMLSGWSVMSTHVYVCAIKGLCGDQPAVNADTNMVISVSGPNLQETAREPLIPGILSVYFDFDRSDFQPDSLIAGYFTRAEEYMSKNTGTKLNITGYTDSIGTNDYNQLLGYRRALTLQYYFKSKGLRTDQMETGSKGETEPSDNNSTAMGRANNRRTVINIKN